MSKYAPFARAGDIVKCLNGHNLYRLLSNITPGTIIESNVFEPIGDAPKPQMGKTIERCHICDMPWITKGISGGFVFCNVQKRLEI